MFVLERNLMTSLVSWNKFYVSLASFPQETKSHLAHIYQDITLVAHYFFITATLSTYDNHEELQLSNV